MPVIGRRPALTILSSGESLLVITEAAKFSIPAFSIGVGNTQQNYYLQDTVYPLGTRVSYSLVSDKGQQSIPIPVLCQHRDSSNGAQPIKVFPLHNALDISISFDETTKTVHCMWWWNGWTPDFINTPLSPPPPPSNLLTSKLPNPPHSFYAAHSIPDPETPAWLRSLVPKTNPSPFDPTKPFWVAPIPEGYQFDYFPMDGVIMGESRVNGSPRMPDTSGARWLQGAVARGLLECPGPPEALFGAVPSPERDDWERRGGVVAAGEHIRLASKRDVPEFVPTPGKNPYTQEVEATDLPGVGKNFVSSTTWEDHLIIINSVKAHYDYANLVNSTRVLMYAKGSILDNATFTTIPLQIIMSDPPYHISFRGPFWPSSSESSKGSVLVLDFPQVVGAFPVLTNYRTLINPDKVWYPLQDYPDIGTAFIDDGFLVDGATPHLMQEAGVDWVVSDPSDAAAELLDVYRNHLDNRSY